MKCVYVACRLALAMMSSQNIIHHQQLSIMSSSPLYLFDSKQLMTVVSGDCCVCVNEGMNWGIHNGSMNRLC